jgi:hypothetical protein
MISQQARLDDKRRIPLCAQGYKSMTEAFSVQKVFWMCIEKAKN